VQRPADEGLREAVTPTASLPSPAVGVELTGARAPVPESPLEPEREASPPVGADHGAGGRSGGSGRTAGRTAGLVLGLGSALPALVLAGWLAAVYPLARAGIATPLPALAVAVPVIATLLGLARRVPAVSRTPWWAVVATLAVVVAFAALAVSRHGEHVVVRRDPGVYALVAHWLAGHGGLTIPTDLAAAGGPSPTFTAVSPGFYLAGAALVPQFMSGAVIALLPGGWLGGWTGILSTPALYSALALLAAAGLVGRLVGPRWAPIGALVLGLCQPVMLSARSTASESTALLLLLGGLCLLVDAVPVRPAVPAGGPGGSAPRPAAASTRSGVGLAALAGLVVGFGLLVRIEAARDVILLVPVIGWLAARRRPQWLGLAGGLAVASAYGVLDALGPSRRYVSDLQAALRPLLALGAALAVGTVVVAVALRRGALRGYRTALAAAGAVAMVGLAVFLFARPWLQTARFANGSARTLPGLQQDQGLAVDGTRSYAEQSLRWVSWYVGWPALIAAGVVAAVLVWRIVRSGDDRWAVALPVLVASAALALYRPGITPDHPWADRRLVVTVLPAVVLLAVCGLAWVTRAVRGRWARPGRAALTLAVAATGATVLAVPAARASWPLAGDRTETGEPAAVAVACAAFGPGDVALLVDARTRQEWMAALRQECEIPTFGVPGQPTDDDATPAEVEAVAARVRAAGGHPVLVAQSASPLPGLARAPQRQVVGLATEEQSRLLTRPATDLVPLSIELWIAPAD